MGTRGSHPPVAPPAGRSHAAHRGALPKWGACARGRPIPAGRHSGAPAPHAPHRPRSRAMPGARQLRGTAGWVGGGRGRQPTSPPPPGRRGRVPVGRSGTQPRRAPHVHGNPPRGHPRLEWDGLIATFHDHGILPDDTWQEVRQKTLSRDYRRRVRAHLLELRDPLRQRWEDLWLRRLGPWSPHSHLLDSCHLCGDHGTVSSPAPTGTNRCTQRSQVAACPWPEPPAGPRRRMAEEALHRRIEGAHTP